MTEETKEIATDEVDDVLVKNTCIKLSEIFSTHIEKAVLEAGRYIIKEFFDDELEKARGKEKEIIKKSSKGNSLNQVFDYFKRDTSKDKSDKSPKTPSKSWLYQSIQFVIHENDLKKELDDKVFQTYGKLLLSHKIVLLSVKDMKEKERLIKKAYDESLTVRSLKSEILKNNSGDDREPGILTIINKPELFLLDESQKKLDFESLKKESPKKLEKFQERLNEKKDAIEKELKEIEDKKISYKQYLEKYNELKERINEAVKYKEANPKKKPEVTKA